MSAEEECAPRCTRKQAVRHALAWGVPAIALALSCRLWRFPAWAAFVESAPCRSIQGVPAWDIVWYGMFVAHPLFFALLALCVPGLRGYRILRDGQAPCEGGRVYRPTVSVRGVGSRWIGYAHLLPGVLPLAVSGWGHGRATRLLREEPVPMVDCARRLSMEPAPEPGSSADRYCMAESDAAS